MTNWSCLEFSIPCDKQEIVSTLLWEMETAGIEEVDETQGWAHLKAYFPPEIPLKKIAAAFTQKCRSLKITARKLNPQPVENRDWLAEWRATLQPFKVGRRFFIVPAEQNAPRIPPKRIPLLLEPGMAFGTGTHETTQLCLEAIERLVQPGSSLLDVGTGSGILAMASVKLGALKVVGCDTDPDAIKVARSNFQMNQCAMKTTLLTGDIESTGRRQFDIVVANLTIEPIELTFVQMEKRVRAGGWLILSGILKEQVPRLKPLITRSSLKKVHLRSKGEWCCFILMKSPGKIPLSK